MPASSALRKLMDGNARFVAGKPQSLPLVSRICELASRQQPFATVLGCADSRVPVETLFDREPGEIFVVRLAGNFVSDAALGSVEYAVAILGSPLVVVLGHTKCGAVQAAIDAVATGARFPGHIQMLADAVAPAARSSEHSAGDWWHNAVVENVRLNARKLRTSTPVLTEAASRGVQVVGAVYDLTTGRVTVVD